MSLINAVSARLHAIARSLIAFSIALAISSGAFAQNLGTIFSDVWWNPAESGWGLTVAHQQNFMFLTFFLYRADGTPYWVTGQVQKVGNAGLANWPQVFSGPVYETHGPWFGGPFNSSAVGATAVGTVTFSASTAFAATLQYSVNGNTMTKAIERQSLSLINYSSTYLGGTIFVLSQCAIPANNGTTTTDSGSMTITQSGSSFQMVTQTQTGTCNFKGTYTQKGSVGAVDGTFSCSDGQAGPFSMSGMAWTTYGASAYMTGNNQVCHFQGVVGGITGNHVQ